MPNRGTGGGPVTEPSGMWVRRDCCLMTDAGSHGWKVLETRYDTVNTLTLCDYGLKTFQTYALCYAFHHVPKNPRTPLRPHSRF